MTPATTFAGRKLALFGLGGSGIATALALKAGDADVIAWDDSAPSRERAQAAGIATTDLTRADWSGFAALVLAPGVPLTHPKPHWTVERAKAAGIEIIGDIELFCRERAKIAPEAPFVAITGTNGKSTTTALIAHILREAGNDVQMGGNIGTAILSLEPPSDDRVHVIEMSSFQIDLTPSLNPSVGVLLNITPDHLDRHGTMENYAAVKARVVLQAQIAIISKDDQYCKNIIGDVKDLAEPIRLRMMSVTDSLQDGYYFQRGNSAVRESSWGERSYGGYELCTIADVKTLRGLHNAQNAVAAVAAIDTLSFYKLKVESKRRHWFMEENFQPAEPGDKEGVLTFSRAVQVADEKIDKLDLKLPAGGRLGYQRYIETFPGLPHRMEQVGRVGRVLFVNDSKATNADSTEKALLSFDHVFWILGGKAKEGGIAPLKPLFTKIDKAYLIGEASDAFAATLGDVPYEMCGTLDRAVAAAAADAARSEADEPVILLSPACASYDQYPNFEVRGDHFRELVRALPGVTMRS